MTSKAFAHPVLVTRPYLPPRHQIDAYLDSIYTSQILSNNGPLVRELEINIAKNVNAKHVIAVSSCTTGLLLLYKVLGLHQRVITTPFSFIATSSSLVWSNLSPVFVDIDAGSWNIDSHLIERAISSDVSAIVVPHVFGNSCDIENICFLAEKYQLKVIFDAAHCIGAQSCEQTELTAANASVLSLHATKLVNSIEGGAIVTNDDQLAQQLRLAANFGLAGSNDIQALGINAKMNEVEAAFGLASLSALPELLQKRKAIYERYALNLKGYVEQQICHNASQPHMFCPFLFKSAEQAEQVIQYLNQHNVFPRRYFFPALHTVPYLNIVSQSLPVAEAVSAKILCLPSYHELPLSSVDLICELIVNALHGLER